MKVSFQLSPLPDESLQKEQSLCLRAPSKIYRSRDPSVPETPLTASESRRYLLWSKCSGQSGHASHFARDSSPHCESLPSASFRRPQSSNERQSPGDCSWCPRVRSSPSDARESRGFSEPSEGHPD